MRIERVRAWWASERTRHFLWVPACFIAGIALYYGLPVEPSPYALPLVSFGALVAALSIRHPLMLALLLILLGASYANIRTAQHQPTMLREALSPRLVQGSVRDIERTERGVRILMNAVRVDDLAPELTPKQIRLSVKFKKGAEFELPRIGDAITIRAGLMPAMGPALPNGFDFARYFYFRDIGAIGYGLPPWEVLDAKKAGDDEATTNRFWTWRANLTDRIVRALGPETGGIAAGLITGDGRAISEVDFDALRGSNLYHIIAISGEHMVIIAGVIFISLRLLLLLLPKRFALRPEGKSIAAAISLLLVTIYLFVTGLPVSAVRAYVMITLVLLAVILRRQVDAMRSLAIAALLMVLYDPACVLEPGFQLSFAATLAIIALVEMRMLAKPPAIERGPIRRTLHFIGTLLLVSVVAEAATTPLAVSMFNNASLYGVFANSLAAPLVSLFLMPVVALFFVLLPLGLEGVALVLLDHGITALLMLARWVSSLPYAQIFLPSLPSWGLGLFAIGLLWACLWQGRVRRYGVLAALVGFLSVFTVTTPDILISSGLKQIAFRGDDGYVLARGRANAMVAELWANGLGYRELPKAETPAWRCDVMGCVATVKQQRIAFPYDPAALAEDCIHAALVVGTTMPTACARGAKTIGPEVLSHGSVAAVWMGQPGEFRIESSGDWQGARPWSVTVEQGAD